MAKKLKRIFSSTPKDDDTKGIDAYDNYGLTPLMQAAARGDVERALDIVKAGAEVDKGCKKPKFWLNHDYAPQSTALHIATQHGNRMMIELLLNNGASINAKNEQGETALDCAVKLKKQADREHKQKMNSGFIRSSLQDSFKRINMMRGRYTEVIDLLTAKGATATLHELPVNKHDDEPQESAAPATIDPPIPPPRIFP